MKGSKGFGAATVVAALVIGLAVGGAAGYVFGSSKAAPAPAQTAAETQQAPEAAPQVEVPEETQAPQAEEEMANAGGNYAFDQELVITIGGTELYIDEVNTRVYMARDTFVSQYGEDPWALPVEGNEDMTVGEYAKNQILEDMERVVVLTAHAADYEVSAPDDEAKKTFTSQASEYIAQLGDQVASQFGVTAEAVYKINYDEAYANAVYTQILADLTEELKADEAYASMSDDELEPVLMEKYNELYEGWKEGIEIDATPTWEELTIGTVG